MSIEQHVKPSDSLKNVRYEIRGRLARRAHDLERQGYEIISLNIGNPRLFGFRTPETMRLAMIENLSDAEGYCHQKGIFPAREAVVMQQQNRGVTGVSAEEVFIGNGVSELIDLVLRALLNDGDEVLVPSPDYPLWTAAVNLNRGRAVHYACRPENDFVPDPEEIESQITPRTRAIVVINPNNPTGATYPRAVLEAIARVAERHQLVVFSDEIYDQMVYDGAESIPMATVVKETLCATLSGLSKIYRACGYRVGWAVFSGRLRGAAEYLSSLELLSSLRLCSNVPAQWAVQTALGGYQSIRELVSPGGRLYESRRALLEAVHRSPYLQVRGMHGAMYAFIGVNPEAIPHFDDQQFALDLLEQKHVLIAPGVSFNVPYRNHFRVTTLPDAGMLKTVFSRMEELLSVQAAQPPTRSGGERGTVLKAQGASNRFQRHLSTHLLEISSQISAHLEAGGTLLVPSRQRANAVRLAYTAAMLKRGRRVWDSPDVLPWSAWLERELDAARERGTEMPRRLTAMEEWLLWQEAVQTASAGFEVLMPDGLIEPVRRAIGLMDDYGLDLRNTPTAEAAVLKEARLHFARRCEELQVLGRASWRDSVPFVAAPRPLMLMLAGFPHVGPERRRWLDERGARFAAAGSGTPVPGAARIAAYESPSHEAEAAAAWCAERLTGNAAARLLVVVPQLTEQRHLWQRAFTHRLNASDVLHGRSSSAESNFAIEGGVPLTDYRLVTTAFDLLSLAAGRARFEQLSEVLRSPYVSLATAADIRFALERWLREHNVGSVPLAALLAMKPRVASEIGPAVAEGLESLVAALRGGSSPGAASPDQWAQAWVTHLRHCGWPGEDLSSDEQQVRMRFDQLLGDFAAVIVPAHRLSRGEALQRLQSMARRVAFEPATDDVPVTLSSRLEDPVVDYDGIWVAGLSADVWPPPARPDPLLPLPWQRAAGIPEASAEGQARRAQQLMQRWQSAAGECIYSFARNDGDLRKDRSPLLPALERELPEVPEAPLEQWLSSQVPELETWTEETRPYRPDGVLEGGTRLLELQSLCPFRAYAEYRLEATPLELPQPGVHPRLRGMILHEALERFWKEVSDQSALLSMSPAERDEVARRSAAAAIGASAAREPLQLGERLLSREQSRTVRLIHQLIEWELKRPAFLTRILESPQALRLAGATLDLRPDRIDQLRDGRLVILDYKTGAPKKFDALADRLPQPQLPAYAVSSGELPAAVVTLYIGRDGVKARGLQDQKGRISHLPTPKDGELTWPERMRRWRQQLELLITEYLQGDAGLRPQPDACKYCHLHALCRIDPATLAALDTDPDAAEGEDAELETDEETQ